jgi:hypothetical protein
MASNEAALRIAATLHAPARLSPLARGIGYRLVWAAGVSVLLWIAVFWALS